VEVRRIFQGEMSLAEAERLVRKKSRDRVSLLDSARVGFPTIKGNWRGDEASRGNLRKGIKERRRRCYALRGTNGNCTKKKKVDRRGKRLPHPQQRG